MKLPAHVRRTLRPAADLGIRAWARAVAPTYDARNTILMASSGRGGSTWLAELLLTMPGYPLAWEPLHLGSNPEARKYGFDWQCYIPIGAHEPRKREYLDGIFSLRGLNIEHFSSSHFELRRFVEFRGLLVKFTCANLLYPWLLREFPLRGILLIRHPCAVVSSQMRHGSWNGTNRETLTFSPELRAAFPHFVDAFNRIETPEEALAFEWATQVYVPLASARPHPWHLVVYEDLVEHGRTTLAGIFDFLGEPMPEAAVQQLREPSATTVQDTKDKQGEDELDRWKQALSPAQIARIYGIVHAMGIHFYDGDRGPDRDGMARLGLP